jgi:hypothetical protein
MMLEGSVIFQELPLTKTSGKGKKPVPICETCGAKMVKYKHSISIPLVKALTALMETGIEPVHLYHLKLTYNEESNFHKLRYFDLVEPYYTDGERVGGVWFITQLGIDFLRGKAEIRKSAWSYRSEWVGWEGKLVKVTDVDEGYKHKEEWAAEARPYDKEWEDENRLEEDK